MELDAGTRARTDGGHRALATRIAAHPRFPAALTRFCHDIPSVFTGEARTMRAIVENRHWGVAILVVHLHLAASANEGPPPTRALLGRMERLRAVTGRDGLKGIIDVLCALKLVAEEPVAGDRRARALRPLPSLLALMHRSLAVRRRAVGALLEDAPAPCGRDCDGTLRLFLAERIAPWLQGSSDPLSGYPEARYFTAHANAYFLMLAMLEQAERHNNTLPVGFNKNALAERLHVTRPHIAKVLRGAVERGMLEELADGRYVLSVEAWQRMRGWIAVELAIDALALRLELPPPA